MNAFVDVTVPLHQNLPTWPDGAGFRMITEIWEEDGDVIRNSSVTADVHAGTHVDAPSHFLREGAPLEEMDLRSFMGEAYVVEIPDRVRIIDAAALEDARIPAATERLLIKTANRQWWPDADRFHEEYVALDDSGARWCVDRKLVLVGIDYLSVQARSATPETHRELMRAGIAIIEGLDLREVEAGTFDLICLPMRIAGAEGAPVRALLRSTEPGSQV